MTVPAAHYVGWGAGVGNDPHDPLIFRFGSLKVKKSIKARTSG